MSDKNILNRTPKLRVSDSKKSANDFKHTKEVIDYYIGSSYFINDVINPSADIRDLRILYEAYNNRLPEEFFRYVTNPLNTSNDDYRNWPARLRAYSIIRPSIDLLSGEYEKRPFSYAVKVNNADAINFYEDEQYKKILQVLEQQFINMMNEKGVDTGQESQEIEPPEKIKNLQLSTYKDKRAELGEAALDIIVDDLFLVELFKKLFKDWMIAGECYTFKGIRAGQMAHERVSPLDIDYDKSPDADYIEDGQWAVRRMYVTPSEIYDMFYQEISESELDMVEDTNGNLSFKSISTQSWYNIRTDEDLRRTKVALYHVVWKYPTKIGILSFLSQDTGELEQIEVPENYKVQEGESVEWFWVNQVWEGYRLEDETYFGIGPILNQRNTVNNMSSCKLPYNGKRFSDIHSTNTSIVELGLPYEILHRILHFNLEKTIAKSKGKIALIDQGAIPKKFGWDEEKFFYYAEATGWGLMDRTQPGADRSFNQYTTLDMGLYEHITNIIDVMEYVKKEWDDLLGITRQRKGETKATDTATGVQSAIYQSSIISEKIFSAFEDFIQRELQGILDVSKLAWIDGFQRLHKGDDLRNVLFQVDPPIYVETDYGVHVSKSPRDIQNLEMVRQRVQEFAQNGVPPSTIVDIVQTKSLSRLRNILKEAEQKSMEAQQKMKLAEQEAEQRNLMIKESFAQLQGLIEERLIHTKYDREEDLELLKQTGEDQNIDPVIDPSDAQKVQADIQNKQSDMALKQKKEAREERQKDRELDLKEKELKLRDEISKRQARVALKNKVSGEK